MGMIKPIKYLLKWPVLIYLGTCLFIVAFALAQPIFEPIHFKKADVIVVLGAGMSEDGTLHDSTKGRVKAALELVQLGASSKLHMTGGRAVPDGPAAGEQMAKYAVELGFPADAITTENESLSTLQNALFSAPQLADAERIILVTEGFHLPRAYLSFAWATDAELALAHSTRFRKDGAVQMVIREAAAWWFNLARLGLWQMAGNSGSENADALLQ